jgi:hypothetical protein
LPRFQVRRESEPFRQQGLHEFLYRQQRDVRGRAGIDVEPQRLQPRWIVGELKAAQVVGEEYDIA